MGRRTSRGQCNPPPLRCVLSEPIKIRRPSELSKLQLWRFRPNGPPGKVQLIAEGPSTEKLRAWERQLTTFQSPCGCDQGAGGLLVGAIAYLLYLLLRTGGWAHPGWHELWIGCGVACLTTSAGKGIGILWTRRKLRQVIQEIRAEWKPQPSQGRNFGPVPTASPRLPRKCCGG